MNTLASDPVLRSKRELIEKFIERTIPKLDDSDEVSGEFETFWAKEKVEAFEKMCKEEGVMTEKLQKIIDNYLFTGQKPRRDDLANALLVQPKILERESIITKISKKLNKFIDTFIEGV
jgi:type I restriction enzyme, R subunit